MSKVATVEIVQAVAMHSNPQPCHGVWNKRADLVIRRTVGVLGVMPKMLDALSIQAVQARFRSDPQFSCGTQGECGDHIVAWAGRILGIVAICGESFRYACPPV